MTDYLCSCSVMIGNNFSQCSCEKKLNSNSLLYELQLKIFNITIELKSSPKNYAII